MPVWKRYLGVRVKRGDKGYDRGTWIASGRVAGQSYKVALPKESIKTAEAARQKDDEIRSKIRDGEFIWDKIKFSDFVQDTYLPYCQLNNESYKQKIIECRFLTRFFKDMLLQSVTPEKCEDYKRWRMVQKKRCQKCISGTHSICDTGTVKNSTINRELTTLQKLLEIALRNHKIKNNPMRSVAKMTEGAPRERFLSHDEKKRLLEAVSKNRHLRAIVPLALLTGWRKGQLLGIRKKDLDHNQQSVSIIKSKQTAARKVPVSKMAWDILMQLAEIADDHLFMNNKGEPLGDFKEAWWNALKIARIEDFHFHDLRHTFATDMLAAGAGEFAIQAALGHANIKTTKIYAHVQNDGLRLALEAVSRGDNGNPQAIFEPTEILQ